ncbi:MAG: hypothetical protein OHK0045_01640 [Raineya sp.]
MKTSYYFFATILFLGAVFYNCTQKQNSQTELKNDSLLKPTLNYAKYTDSTIYPNGGSELAVLMREMYDDADLIKKAVLNKELPPDFRKKFAYLHWASPTDADTKTEAYPDMAKAFMDNLEALYNEKDTEKRIKKFDIVVQNCITCHQSHCPGPIKKIKKLRTSQ